MNKINLKQTLVMAVLITATSMVTVNAQSNKKFENEFKQMIDESFRTEKLVTKDVVNQDATQFACSNPHSLNGEKYKKLRSSIEAENYASIVYPADGNYFGDIKKGESIAQSGRGLTWTDDEKVVPGGGCYNCHQLSPKEISFGTIGPPLYNYGKIRGNSEAIIKYTWGKIYNAKAFNACSLMPRNAYGKILSEDDMRHIMSLLLDPESPVNK